MFQSTVYYQYATGIPGEVINDGPLRVSSFRLVSNTTVPAAIPGITFGNAFSYAALGDVGNPNNLAYTQTATPGAATATDVFAGILVNPKEHALYGDTTGPLAASFSLPNGAWGELCTMGIILVNITTPATGGNAGSHVAYNIVDGTLVSFTGATVPAGAIAIPGAVLLSNVGPSQTAALARISLNGIGNVLPA